MSSGPAQRQGFTLVEVLIAAALGALVMWGVLATNLHLARSGVRLTHYTEMDAQVRRALEQFGHDARIATAIKWNSASDVTLSLPTSSGTTTDTTYAWTAASAAFFSVPGASSAATNGRTILVRSVPALTGGAAAVSFTRFDREGAAATTDLATKRLQVSISISRAPTTAATTRDVVSATYTLRNKPVQ